MKIDIRINGAFVSIDTTEEVGQFLVQAERKEENLRHEQRRHWEQRELDETDLAHQYNYSNYTPEQHYLRRERLETIHDTLSQCTPTQRQRFMLYVLNGLSYAEIARRDNCSKASVQNSIEAVRKKIQENLK